MLAHSSSVPAARRGAGPGSRRAKLLAAALALTASCSDPTGPSLTMSFEDLAPPVPRTVRAQERTIVVEDQWNLRTACWTLAAARAQLAGRTLTITIREERNRVVVACPQVGVTYAFRVTVADLPPDPKVLRVLVLKEVYGDGGRWEGISRVFETAVVRP